MNLSNNNNMPLAITLIGQSIIYQLINSTYVELGVTTTNNIIPIINGTVNTSQYGSYYITYIATDSHNNTVSTMRQVYVVNNIPSLSYDITEDFIGPLTGYNINNSNWTVECWINQTELNNNSCIFNFSFNKNNLILNIDNKDNNNNSDIILSTNAVPLNKWTHIVWMCNNNNIYTFINGISTLIATNPPWINTLSSLNSITINKFDGQICQPLISLFAKYDITGFTPEWNLKPDNMNNVIFWIENDFDNYSYNPIIPKETVNKNIINNPLCPIVTLKDNNPYYLLINNTYDDPGVEVVDYITNESLPYTISGSVDSSKLGKYNIIYDNYDTIRTIYVVDEIPDLSNSNDMITINLNGPLEISLLIYSTYIDQGASAIDIFGNELSVTIIGSVNFNELGTYILTYTASNMYDSLTKTRTINIISPQNPKIILNGPDILNVQVYSLYNELGVRGSDLYNNTISTYTVIGSVDTSIIGQYILNYIVTDIYGISSINIVSRTINVLNNVSINVYDNLELNNLNLSRMNNEDWTFEIWLKNNNNSNNSLDISEKICLSINQNKPRITCSEIMLDFEININYNIIFDHWYHLVLMRKNNLLYVFINGICSSPNNILSCMNNFDQLSNIKIVGLLCQPLITLGAKYNLSGFDPIWNLTPFNYSNILLWLENNYDIISFQQNISNYTIIEKSPLIPIIKLNGSNPYSVLINSTFIDPGCIAINYTRGTELSVNIISIKDINNNELLLGPLTLTNPLTICNYI